MSLDEQPLSPSNPLVSVPRTNDGINPHPHAYKATFLNVAVPLTLVLDLYQEL